MLACLGKVVRTPETSPPSAVHADARPAPEQEPERVRIRRYTRETIRRLLTLTTGLRIILGYTGQMKAGVKLAKNGTVVLFCEMTYHK